DDAEVHAPRRPRACGRAGFGGIIADGYSATAPPLRSRHCTFVWTVGDGDFCGLAGTLCLTSLMYGVIIRASSRFQRRHLIRRGQIMNRATITCTSCAILLFGNLAQGGIVVQFNDGADGLVDGKRVDGIIVTGTTGKENEANGFTLQLPAVGDTDDE